MATTTPNYGWDVPTSTDYVKDGATAIETLGDDIDATLYQALGFNYPGLRLVKKQTIGSAVSSVAVTSAFSATYDAYKIIIAGGVASTNNEFNFILTGSTTGYYGGAIYKPFASTTVAGTSVVNAASWTTGFGSTSNLVMNMELHSPFLTKTSTFSINTPSNNTGGAVVISNGLHDSAASYTGFTISTNTGTITGGTIYVYGYGAS